MVFIQAISLNFFMIYNYSLITGKFHFQAIFSRSFASIIVTFSSLYNDSAHLGEHCNNKVAHSVSAYFNIGKRMLERHPLPDNIVKKDGFVLHKPDEW